MQWTDAQLDNLLALATSVTPIDLVSSHARRQLIDRTAPELNELAAAIRSDLLTGTGFTLLTGFPVAELERENIVAAFLVFGSLVGSPRSQNADGHLLGHVKNIGRDADDPATRIYQTNERQTFHTDSTDAVALLCLRTAREGGESMLVSVEAAYAEMVRRNPRLAARLFDPIATDRRDEQPPGEKPWFEIPVLSWFDDRLTVIYQRQYIESARRFADAPHPDAEHAEALDLFDDVVNDPEFHLRMNFAPGDMQFVHNHSLLHDRGGFVDHPEPNRRRHLLRLWLSLEGDRRLPAVFEQRYGSITVGDRGGIVVEGTEYRVPLDVAEYDA